MMYNTYKCFKTVTDVIKQHNLKFELPHNWVVTTLSEEHHFYQVFGTHLQM